MEAPNYPKFLDISPNQGFSLTWLKCQFNRCVVKLNMGYNGTGHFDRQQLLDQCAYLYEQIQEQECHLHKKQTPLSEDKPRTTTD